MSSDAVIQMMKDSGVPVTRENYIELSWGLPLPKWNAELEAELPRGLQDWSLFETVGNSVVMKKKK